ncbi:MAG: nicotinate (nicotinamide) nucleotide adenylyltransferase [Candidatus Hydrogenedentes bacterium]|nr:nicotinate (nicotinamide) nucleotide adenylyltransferase [Candidatus Hydrogenedentota bacterium]
MSNPERIGVFGGTFDPIHLGHLAIAKTAMTQAELNKVLFVIAAAPPHKPGQSITPAETRVAMTEAAIKNEAGFELSRIELDRPGPSYTAVTLGLIQEAMPGARLFFIVGYDSALDLPRWHCPDEILRRATLLIAPRPENRRPLPRMLNNHHEMLVMAESPLSSSDIRARLKRGEMPSDALPAPVTEIIRRERLYQSCP